MAEAECLYQESDVLLLVFRDQLKKVLHGDGYLLDEAIITWTKLLQLHEFVSEIFIVVATEKCLNLYAIVVKGPSDENQFAQLGNIYEGFIWGQVLC